MDSDFRDPQSAPGVDHSFEENWHETKACRAACAGGRGAASCLIYYSRVSPETESCCGNKLYTARWMKYNIPQVHKRGDFAVNWTVETGMTKPIVVATATQISSRASSPALRSTSQVRVSCLDEPREPHRLNSTRSCHNGESMMFEEK